MHLSNFPTFHGEIESGILSDTRVVRELISTALKLRNEKQIKIKQPLAVMYIKGNKLKNAVLSMFDIIKDELNVKSIVSVYIPGYNKLLSSELFSLETSFKNNFVITENNEFSVALDIALDEKLIYEGLYRELLRHCQVLRKEAGFNVEERIKLAISSESDEVNTILIKYYDEIVTETLALSIEKKLTNPKYEKEIVVADFHVVLQLCGEKDS